MSWTTSPIPSRCSSTSPSPTARAICPRGPSRRDGQPVECREAARRRDALIEQLASLPPVPGALDQIVQRFGTDLVAEVTGRSRRIVRKGEGPAARLVVESRRGRPTSRKPPPSWMTRSAS
jgi:hypothetical protein